MDQHQHIVCKWFKYLSESLVLAFCHTDTASQLVSLPMKHRQVGHDSGWHWCNCQLPSPQIFVFLADGSICWFCWLKASCSTGSSGRFWRVSACVNMTPRSPDGLLKTNLGNIYMSFCCSFSWMCYSCFLTTHSQIFPPTIDGRCKNSEGCEHCSNLPRVKGTCSAEGSLMWWTCILIKINKILSRLSGEAVKEEPDFSRLALLSVWTLLLTRVSLSSFRYVLCCRPPSALPPWLPPSTVPIATPQPVTRNCF